MTTLADQTPAPAAAGDPKSRLGNPSLGPAWFQRLISVLAIAFSVWVVWKFGGDPDPAVRRQALEGGFGLVGTIVVVYTLRTGVADSGIIDRILGRK